MTRLGFAVVAVAILSVAQTASAHFSLTYPPTRGFSESIEANAPCGGYDTPSANRSSFLLKDGFVEINAEHPSYTYQVNILINSNPTSADFTSSNLVTVASGQNSFPLAACIPVNLTDVSGATNGTLATLQVTFNGGDGALYQCTDVVLTSNTEGFNSSKCINADGSSSSATASQSSSAPQAKGSNGSSSGASSLATTGSLIFGAAAILASIALA